MVYCSGEFVYYITGECTIIIEGTDNGIKNRISSRNKTIRMKTVKKNQDGINNPPGSSSGGPKE
ncbi:LOW QUALITY PROTEIN: hypothetical protein HZS_2009 [Henneguya salminicola]|nr:LOW QUALITY PROTEIN: hypothetical protein HZS_2009 [Henneguya salminicola]